MDLIDQSQAFRLKLGGINLHLTSLNDQSVTVNPALQELECQVRQGSPISAPAVTLPKRRNVRRHVAKKVGRASRPSPAQRKKTGETPIPLCGRCDSLGDAFESAVLHFPSAASSGMAGWSG